MTCGRCGEEVRRIYSIASDGEDDYLAECGCVDWDGWIALGFGILMITVFVCLGTWCKP